MAEDRALYAPVDAPKMTMRNRCPRCGQGKLFKGFLSLPPGCPNCGLDYEFIDSGDGPAVFVILIISFFVVGLALWVDFTWSPPIWVHIVLWLPLTLALCLPLLRFLKGLMIGLQYKNRAAEGRLSDDVED